MENPMICKIDQVSVVVEDAIAAVHYLTENFGIGPWMHLQFGDDGVTDTRYGSIENCVTEGDPIGTYCIDCCCCDMANGAQIEVISPKKGSSIFERYLRRHGPGAQHISIVISDSYENTLARMADAGFATGQFATVIRDETCAFIDHLQVIGTYMELHKRPDDWETPSGDGIDLDFIPGPAPQDLPAKAPVFRQLDQINIVAEDLEGSLAVLEGKYGLGPWERKDTEQEMSAVCSALNMRIKLTQPLDPESPDGRFLAAHGTDIRSFSAKMTAPPAEGVPLQDEGEILRVPDDGTLGVEIELEK